MKLNSDNAAIEQGPAESGSSLGGFFSGIVGRPVALLVIFATLIVMGLISYARIPVQLMPSEFTEPSIHIYLPNPGSTARENEERVARPIEEQLRTLIGIDSISSYSYENNVQFNIRFQSNVDMALARAEVRDRIERARPNLPSTAEAAAMWSESASSLPLSFFAVRVAGDPDRRDYLLEKVIQPRMEAVQGIGKVDIWGVQQDSIRILLDEDKVISAGLNLGAVIGRLSADNFALPLGEVKDGGREIILRSDMRFTSVDEIAEFPITDELKLKDVGIVAKVKEAQTQNSLIDGDFAYYGMATKDSQANVVETSRAFTAMLEALEEDPATNGDVSVTTLFIQGDMIEGALDQMRMTAIWGGMLAVVVLFVFLRRVRLTLCVALSIPVSAMLAIAHAFFTGGSFNLLTMTGITLGIGMLVDNSVVVVENIVRIKARGEHHLTAAAVGTRQIALAVTCATLTTVVVFMPLIFMTDNRMVRVIMGNLGIPLCVSLLASLLVATVFLPVITARILGKGTTKVSRAEQLLGALGRIPVRFLAQIIGGLRYAFYVAVRVAHSGNNLALRVIAPLRWPILLALIGFTVWQGRLGNEASELESALGQYDMQFGVSQEGTRIIRWAFRLVILGILVFGTARWRKRRNAPPARPTSFVPAGDSLVDMIVQANQSLVTWALEHRLLASVVGFVSFLSILIPLSITSTGATGGSDMDDDADFRVVFDADFTEEEAEGQVRLYADFIESKREELGYDHWTCRFDEHGADFSIYFGELKQEVEVDKIEDQLQRDLPRIPGHRLISYDANASGGQTNAVASFVLTGPDSRELERLGEEAIAILEGVPGLSEVSSPLARAPEMIEVSVDRELALGLGVTSESIQNSIAWTLGGWPLPRYHDEGREIPLIIEYDKDKTAGISSLRDLSVFSETGSVSLASFTELGYTKAAQSIYRRNGQTSFTLEARVEDPLRIIPITQAAYLELEALELPRGFAWDRSESAFQKTQDEFSELFRATVFAIVLVFLLMGFLFESVILPFSVLFTVPFAFMGARWTLLLTGTSFDALGFIGMIILAGVVVNNGIVLVDRMHALRGTLDRKQAVLEGCKQRVRPVLMTALTTISGLLPMAITEPASQSVLDYRSLATIVAGGLAASTFFTLWVVPLAYTIFDDLSHILRAWFQRVIRPAVRPGWLSRSKDRQPALPG